MGCSSKRTIQIGRGAKIVYKIILEQDMGSQFRKKKNELLKPYSQLKAHFFLYLQTLKNFCFHTLKAKIKLF